MKNVALLAAVQLVACGTLAFSNAAAAQTARWSGYYLGADVGLQGGRSSDLTATLIPARDNRFVYIEGAETRDFGRERAISRKTFAGIRAGRLFEQGAFVWGVELEANAARLEQRFTVGPIDAGPIATNGVLLSGAVPSRVNNSNDTLTADLKINAVTSIRARIGVPVSNRIFASIFGGPSFSNASIEAKQDSLIVIQTCNNPLRPTLCGVQGQDVSSQGSDEDKLLAGAVVGAALDFQMTEHWGIHGEASLSRYQSIDADAGNGSRLSYEPELYSAGLGLTYRF